MSGWYKHLLVSVRQRCSKRMRCRMVCVCLTNQQKDGDSPVQSIVAGLCA